MRLNQLIHGFVYVGVGLVFLTSCTPDPASSDQPEDKDTSSVAPSPDDTDHLIINDDDSEGIIPDDSDDPASTDDPDDSDDPVSTDDPASTDDPEDSDDEELPCFPTFIDPFTGLCWQTIVDPEGSHGWPLSTDFETANTTCEDLIFNGHDDWRLPTINEHRANLSTDCTETTIGGSCDIRIDCDLYPFLDDCVAFDKTWEERNVDDCESCNWLSNGECKWIISLGNNCSGSFWSSSEIQYDESVAQYRMGYSNGFIGKSVSFGSFVACVRQEQPLDERKAPLNVVLPDEDGGCDPEGNTICSMLKGADFGIGDYSHGWYFDGESCIEAVGDEAKKDEFCLYPTDVECAMGCAAEDQCNPKRLDREIQSFYWDDPRSYEDGSPDMGGGYLCCDDSKTSVLDDMYTDTIAWFSTEGTPCNGGNRRGDFLFPKDNDPNFPRIYEDLSQDEFRQLCAYSLLTWVEFVRGVIVD